MQRLIWMRQETWKPDYPTFSYKWTLRACWTFQQRSAATHRPLTGERSSLPKPDQACSLGKNAHGAVREEGNYLPSQSDQLNQPRTSLGSQMSWPDCSYIFMCLFYHNYVVIPYRKMICNISSTALIGFITVLGIQ